MSPAPSDPDGGMYRRPVAPPMPPRRWFLVDSTVRVKDGFLIYTPSPQADTAGDQEMLGRFLRVPEMTDEEIADYALDYGALGLCMHGRPRGWLRFENGAKVIDNCSEFHRTNPVPGDTRFKESLNFWRGFASTLRALVQVADRVQSRTESTPEQIRWLETLLPNGSYPRASAFPGSETATDAQLRRAQLEWDRWYLQDAVNNLLEDSLRATVEFTSTSAPRPEMGFAARTLADALVIQAVLAVCRADAAMTCDGCGTVFIPSASYRPRANQRRFCETCRDARIPQKFANRDRRARARQEGDSR